MSLPPATVTSVPINDFANANERVLAQLQMQHYYECCGKYVCGGCVHSFADSGNDDKCPYCKSDRRINNDEKRAEELRKRIEVNDAVAMYVLGGYYNNGKYGLLQDQEKAMELWKQAAKLGSSHAHYSLGFFEEERGDLKKAKFHLEAAAIAGHEIARYHLGLMEGDAGNMDRALKHCIIAASAGNYKAMQNLIVAGVSRGLINSTLIAYNNSCAEMRSEARDAFIRLNIDRIGNDTIHQF
jgi:TPR repeat protein